MAATKAMLGAFRDAASMDLRGRCGREQMAEGAVPMRSDIRDRLQLAVWNVLLHDARVDVIKEMTELLTEAGYDLELLGLASYRSAPQPQIPCHWRDRATGLSFALVPGGTFRPGFDAQ